MSKREREDGEDLVAEASGGKSGGPEYVIVEVKDSMEACVSTYYQALRAKVTREELDEIVEGEVEVEEEGEWSMLEESKVQDFTREHWCEWVVTDNE